MRPVTVLCALGVLSGAASAEIICTTTVVGLAFGEYDARAALPLTAPGSVTVQCRTTALLTLGNVPFTISLGAGRNGTPGNRAMNAGPSLLRYSLLTPTGLPWGDGTAGTVTVSGVAAVPLLPGAGSPLRTPITGVVPVGQFVQVGSYTDSVTVTVEY